MWHVISSFAKHLCGTLLFLLGLSLLTSCTESASEQEIFVRSEPYASHFEKGVYQCTKCGKPLFSSSQKVKSSSRWPVFSGALESAIRIQNYELAKGSEKRSRLLCAHCHLQVGHLCRDGEEMNSGDSLPHYCALSSSLNFQPSAKEAE